MTKESEQNPLLAPQREKSGAQTYQKYSYQYHWALYRLVAEHRAKREYAVFVELHEDVVLSDSLIKSKAKFEFNQVKTNSQVFTASNLTKLKNGSSVLGKLLSSCTNRCYALKIKQINLISTSGYSIPLKQDGLNFEKLNISQISDASAKDIKKNLKAEIGISALPATLHFIVAELEVKNHQKTIIGEIAEMISSLFPESQYDPVNIYRLLFDELSKKGMNQFDYELWDESLTKKALTCSTVTRTINELTKHKDEDRIEREFAKIADELGWKTLKRNNILKSLIRYRNKRVGARTSSQLRRSQKMQSQIRSNLSECGDDIANLVEIVKNELPATITNTFRSDDDLTAAIICEYIMGI